MPVAAVPGDSEERLCVLSFSKKGSNLCARVDARFGRVQAAGSTPGAGLNLSWARCWLGIVARGGEIFSDDTGGVVLRVTCGLYQLSLIHVGAPPQNVFETSVTLSVTFVRTRNKMIMFSAEGSTLVG